MDPRVGCHGFIAISTRNIWSKYECFLISGSQGTGFQDFNAVNPPFEDVLDFDL